MVEGSGVRGQRLTGRGRGWRVIQIVSAARRCGDDNDDDDSPRQFPIVGGATPTCVYENGNEIIALATPKEELAPPQFSRFSPVPRVYCNHNRLPQTFVDHLWFFIVIFPHFLLIAVNYARISGSPYTFLCYLNI